MGNILSVVNKTNVVFIHGWGMNRHIWQPSLQTLEHPQFNFVAIDLPGYGEFTPKGDEAYSIEWITEQLAKVITEPSMIVGWSLGGLAAIHFANKHPNLVNKLLLVASSCQFAESDSWPGIKPNVLSLFRKQLANDYKTTIDRFMAIQAMGSESAKQDIKQVRNLILQKSAPPLEVLEGGLKILAEYNAKNELANLTMPVFALFGRLDSLVPKKAIPLMQQVLPTMNVTIEDKASHGPFISHPESFKQWLLASLEQQC